MRNSSLFSAALAALFCVCANPLFAAETDAAKDNNIAAKAEAEAAPQAVIEAAPKAEAEAAPKAEAEDTPKAEVEAAPKAEAQTASAETGAQTKEVKAPEISLIPFKGYDLDGKLVDVAASMGKKPVMLVFWASWCPSCKEELPKVNGLMQQYAEKGMDFVGVNIGQNDSYKRAKAFCAKYGMVYPTYFDGSGLISRQYAVQGVPTIVIADKKGIIRYYDHAVPDISEDIFQKLTAD